MSLPLFHQQVDELLKAQGGGAQTMVRELAACELDSFRAFTNNSFYQAAVDKMRQCLAEIQADGGSRPDTSMFGWLGMSEPLVRVMFSFFMSGVDLTQLENVGSVVRRARPAGGICSGRVIRRCTVEGG